MVALELRDTQTQVKHLILERYVPRWGGIITNGLRRTVARLGKYGRRAHVHFIYVDACAGVGRYAGDRASILRAESTETKFGSPVIGLRALESIKGFAHEAGLDVQTNAILVEEVPSRFGVLEESLALAGLANRIKATDQFSTLRDGEAAVINGDFRDYAERILKFTKQDYRFAFYFLDPYGPKAIPLTVVAPIISQRRHDVMINFPYQDLHKKSGIVRKEMLSSAEHQLVQNHTQMFGSDEWIDLVQQIAASTLTGEQYTAAMEQKLVELYQKVLTDVDDHLAIKSIRLRFSEKERTMFYLFLTTHDPNGALALNEILWDARLAEHELRWRLWFAKKFAKQREAGQLSMFDLMGVDDGFHAPSPQMPPRPEKEHIADGILKAFSSKQKVQFVDILKTFADSPCFVGEVKRAMTYLKKQKRVTYSSPLTNKSGVTFS